MKLNRNDVIFALSDLDHQSIEEGVMDENDRQDYNLMDDECLIEEYCISGLFDEDFPGDHEADIEGMTDSTEPESTPSKTSSPAF